MKYDGFKVRYLLNEADASRGNRHDDVFCAMRAFIRLI